MKLSHLSAVILLFLFLFRVRVENDGLIKSPKPILAIMVKIYETGWKEFDNIREFNNTITFLGARIEKARLRQGIGPKINLKPGALGNISPAYPVGMTNGLHGLPGWDVCPYYGNKPKLSLTGPALDSCSNLAVAKETIIHSRNCKIFHKTLSANMRQLQRISRASFQDPSETS